MVDHISEKQRSRRHAAQTALLAGTEFRCFFPVRHQIPIPDGYLPSLFETDVADGHFEERIEGTRPSCRNSEVIANRLYEKTLRNDEGIRSSTLNHREGKTISCLSVLSKIEKEHVKNEVFIYADTRLWSEKRSITHTLRSILGVQDGEDIGYVLNYLSKFKDGHYKIYAIIDQVDEWQPDDMGTLQSWVIQDFTNLRIHLPTANSDVAEQIDKVNGMRDARFLGEAMPTLRHDLTSSQVRSYVNLLTKDTQMQRTIKQRALDRMKKTNFGYITARQLVLIYKEEQIKNRYMLPAAAKTRSFSNIRE